MKIEKIEKQFVPISFKIVFETESEAKGIIEILNTFDEEEDVPAISKEALKAAEKIASFIKSELINK